MSDTPQIPPPSDLPRDLPRDLRRLGNAPFEQAAQERLMTDLAESLPGAVFQLESDRHNNLRYNFVSGRVREVLGVERQQVLDDPLLPSKLVIAQDSAILFSAYRDSARELRPVNADVRIRRPDGTQRWIRTFATFRKSGERILWDGYWNDVTAEVEAREQLERSEARLRAIMDTVPGVLFQLRRDADGSIGINYLSRGTEQISGVSAEALYRNFGAFLGVVHEDDRALIIDTLQRSESEMRVQEHTVRVHHSDGTVHWIKNIVAPRRTDDGQMLWDGITVDMTAHKRTEEALAQAESRMREITDNLPGVVFQMVYGVYGSARVAHVSEGIGELIGIDRDAASTDLAVLIQNVLPEDRAHVIAETRRMAREAGTLHLEFRLRHLRSGEIRWILARSAGRRMADGSVVSNGFWQDITDIKTLEAELRAARDVAETAARELRELNEALPGVIYRYRVAPNFIGTYTMISDQGTQLFGRTREDILGTPNSLLNMVHKDDLQRLMNNFVLAARTGKHFEFTYRSKVAEGRQAWLRTYAKPVLQADGGLEASGFTIEVTAEMEARQRLEATEKRLGEIVASVPGAIYQIGVRPAGEIEVLYLSDGICELTGLEPDKLGQDLMQPFRTVVDEDADALWVAIREAAASGSPLNVDFRIRHAVRNHLRWIRAAGRPQKQADGSTMFNGFWQDITEARRLEQELREARDAAQAAERRVREITESLPGVVYRMENVGRNTTRFTDMTDAAFSLYGYTREQIMQNPELMSNGVHAEDRVAMRDELMSSARAGRQAQMNFRFNRPDGTYRWLRTYAAAQLIDNGVAWVGYTADMTAEREAQERADEALRQLTLARDAAEAAQQRLRAIFEHTKIGLVMIDENRHFSDANPSLRELLDIEDEQEFTRDFQKFSPPLQPDGRPSMEKAVEVIETAFSSGYNRFDWMHQTPGGDPRPCEIALTRVDLGGKPTIFATMTDLRERVRYEAELRRASEEAQSASRAKGDFLANMSHEIRTPMNAIVGLTHLGLTGGDPARLRDYLAKIDTAAKSLLQIINDILDFSKIEAGKLTLEATPFDLYGVLDNLSDMLNLRAAEKGLELLFAVEPGLASQLVGDPLRLGQVLLNLTGNAIKFTEQGQIVVRVKTAKKGKDFVRLRFEVNDTGIGLSPQQIERLFESFSQADTSTTRRYGGTGLGLVISQRLVDLMDGEIRVDSTPGRGSSFSFTARFGLAPAVNKHAATPTSLRGMRVLVVDDNATAVSILQAYLESFGFEVSSASDGARAVELIRKAGSEHYRLVLMDWQMPGMNGIEAARRIREIVQPEPTVIIMVTAFGREEVERQALRAGLDAFLVKPVNPSVLLDTILGAFGSEAAMEVAKARAPLNPHASLNGRRVLLVEDNEINQEVARELLMREGIVVDVAVNGREAVDCVERADYDAVLMDVQMPVMDGLEATRQIRRLASPRATVPIIAMTANAMAEDRQRCLDAGMNDHLGKPVDVERLQSVLARWTGEPVSRDVPDALAARAVVDSMAPDFDFDAAVRQMAGSRALWDRLARRYLETVSAPAEITALVRAGDGPAARRGAHTLKGVAATLGLLAVQRIAAEVERALAEPQSRGGGEARIEDDLARLRAADETARARIGQHLNRI